MEKQGHYQYGQFSIKHLKTIRRGVELFNEGLFWECHEELEEHWLDDTMDNARNIYWAVIQAAACLYHVENKNLSGATGLINKAKDKLIRCEKLNVETELVYQFLSWKEFKEVVRKIPSLPTLLDFSKLSLFKFKQPQSWEL